MNERMKGGVGFDEDISKLFTKADRNCMGGLGLDLTDWWQVRKIAPEILVKLQSREMPLPSENRAWSQEMIDKFEQWTQEGAPKYRAEKEFSYFDGIDKRTEYEDPPGSGVMSEAITVMGDILPYWKNYAEATDPIDTEEELADLKNKINLKKNKDAIRVIDEMLCEETEKTFLMPDGKSVDVLAILDAFENFGRDRFPKDNGRESQYSNHYDPLHHRMDSTSMWFNWTGQLECAVLLNGENDNRHAIRTAMLNGLIIGCPMDFVFRPDAKGAKLGRAHPRAPTIPDYTNNSATERRIRRKAQRLLRNWNASIEYMRTLYRVYEGIELFIA